MTLNELFPESETVYVIPNARINFVLGQFYFGVMVLVIFIYNFFVTSFYRLPRKPIHTFYWFSDRQWEELISKNNHLVTLGNPIFSISS